MATNVAHAPIALPRYRNTIILSLIGLFVAAAAVWYRDPVLCFGAGSWATSAILSVTHIRDARKAHAENRALRTELGLPQHEEV